MSVHQGACSMDADMYAYASSVTRYSPSQYYKTHYKAHCFYNNITGFMYPDGAQSERRANAKRKLNAERRQNAKSSRKIVNEPSVFVNAG